MIYIILKSNKNIIKIIDKIQKLNYNYLIDRPSVEKGIVMKKIKEYDERKGEILNVAMQLFATKGYQRTTINDILKEVQIAKGTFYYYFKSKEEVLDAIIESVTQVAENRVQEVYKRQDLEPKEKLIEAILALNVQSPDNEGVLEELHEAENALMHQKSLNQIVIKVSPILAKIVEEGVEKGCFHTAYASELSEYFLASAVMITDQGIFNYTPQKQLKMVSMMMYAVEVLLGVEIGSLARMIQQKFKEGGE